LLLTSWSSHVTIHGAIACAACRAGSAFVDGVAGAVVVEREDLLRAVRAHRAFAVALLVDVVAEVHDEIEVLARHVFVGGVVAHLVFLAGGEREAQALRRGPAGGIVRVRPFGLTSLPALN
jgi:hypothetical protein